LIAAFIFLFVNFHAAGICFSSSHGQHASRNSLGDQKKKRKKKETLFLSFFFGYCGSTLFFLYCTAQGHFFKL